GGGALSAIELPVNLGADASLTVYLAVPQFQEGKALVSNNSDQDITRYRVEPFEVEDENTGTNRQPLEVRRLNARLLLSTQSQSGYEVLEIAKVKRAETPAATHQLIKSYIPPLLACSAWKPLADEILQAIFHRVERRRRQLAKKVKDR